MLAVMARASLPQLKVWGMARPLLRVMMALGVVNLAESTGTNRPIRLLLKVGLLTVMDTRPPCLQSLDLGQVRPMPNTPIHRTLCLACLRGRCLIGHSLPPIRRVMDLVQGPKQAVDRL